MRAVAAAGLAAALALAASAAHAQCGRSGDPAFDRGSRRCRRRPPSVPTLRFGVDAAAGAWDSDAPVDHSVVSLGVPVDVAITEWLWLGAAARYLVGGDDGVDGDGDGRDDQDTANPKALLFTGGPRLALFTEPARREAWRFGLSGGYLLAIDGGSDGPVLEAAVERQAGTLLVDGPDAGHGLGHDVALGVRVQQGLGDASGYRALLVSATYATELFVRLPDGERPRRTRPDVEYTLSGELLVGTGFARGGFGYGVGLAAGLPFGRLIELRARGEALGLGGSDEHEGGTLYSALGGLRLSRWYLPWAEVLAGWTHAFGTAAIEPTVVLEFAGGMQFPNAFGCGLGLVVGQRARLGLGDSDQKRFGTLLFTLGVSHDNLIRASQCWP